MIQQGLIASYPGVVTPSSLLTGLVSYYKLEASSVDSLGTNNGTDNAISYVSGKIGNAASFNGTSSYINIGTGFNSIFNQSNWSISLWSNLTTGSGTYGSKYIANDNSSGQRQFSLSLTTLGLLYLETYSSPNVQVFSVLTVPSGWYNLVVIYGSSTVDIYVNDTLYITSAMNAMPTTTNATFLGKREYPSFEGFFGGVIDEVGIWSKALTSGEKTSLYNSGTGLQYPF